MVIMPEWYVLVWYFNHVTWLVNIHTHESTNQPKRTTFCAREFRRMLLGVAKVQTAHAERMLSVWRGVAADLGADLDDDDVGAVGGVDDAAMAGSPGGGGADDDEAEH